MLNFGPTTDLSFCLCVWVRSRMTIPLPFSWQETADGAPPEALDTTLLAWTV